MRVLFGVILSLLCFAYLTTAHATPLAQTASNFTPVFAPTHTRGAPGGSAVASAFAPSIPGTGYVFDEATGITIDFFNSTVDLAVAYRYQPISDLKRSSRRAMSVVGLSLTGMDHVWRISGGRSLSDPDASVSPNVTSAPGAPLDTGPAAVPFMPVIVSIGFFGAGMMALGLVWRRRHLARIAGF